jgi:hypothetical protein
LVLATAFPAAGILAIKTGESIACSCFGPGSEGELGRKQIIAPPLWLAAAAILEINPQ